MTQANIMELVLLLVIAAVFQVDAACDSDWSAHDGNCFKAYNERQERRSFNGALAECEALGATLATVNDVDENLFIAGLIQNPTAARKSVWIGASCTDGAPDDFVWTEESAPGAPTVTTTYRNWFAPPQLLPFPKDIAGTCVTVMDNDAGNYRNPKCNEKHNYVCQKSESCSVANCDGCVLADYCAKCSDGFADIYDDGSCVDLSGACESGWTLDFESETCFKLSTNMVPYTGAAAECGADADFATVSDQRQSDFLSDLITRNAWINEKWESLPGWGPRQSKRPPTVITTDLNDCVMLPVSKDHRQAPRWQPKPCVKQLPVICQKEWNFYANTGSTYSD